LEAQPDDAPLDDLLSDSSDEDYEPVPQMPPPRPHDREASGSISAPPPAPQIDPTLLAILDWMQHEQSRQAEEQQRQAVALAVAQAQINLCQD